MVAKQGDVLTFKTTQFRLCTVNKLLEAELVYSIALTALKKAEIDLKLARKEWEEGK